MKNILALTAICAAAALNSCTATYTSNSGTATEPPQTAIEKEYTYTTKAAIEPQESGESRTSGIVQRVIDGDTYDIEIDGVEYRVRLIGIDTPESVAPEDYYKENTQEGVDVSAAVKEKIHSGDTVYIEYDIQTEDKYGRALAYLFLSDGTMIQDWLLEQGYANVATYPPNTKYAEHFADIAHKAMENHIGLWNGFFKESSQ